MPRPAPRLAPVTMAMRPRRGASSFAAPFSWFVVGMSRSAPWWWERGRLAHARRGVLRKPEAERRGERTGREAGERPHVVHEVRLVGVATSVRDRRPARLPVRAQPLDRGAEAGEPARALGCEADVRMEELLEAPLADAEPRR